MSFDAFTGIKPLPNSGKGGNNTGNGKPKPQPPVSSIFGNK
jgi:hypothetical protein